MSYSTSSSSSSSSSSSFTEPIDFDDGNDGFRVLEQDDYGSEDVYGRPDVYDEGPDILLKDVRQAPDFIIKPFDEELHHAQEEAKHRRELQDSYYVEVDDDPVDTRKAEAKTIEIVSNLNLVMSAKKCDISDT